MLRMSGADAFMLSMETPCAYMHTFKVAILDPSTDPDGWSFERFLDDMQARIHLVPFFRWKYAPSPLGLNHPMWVDDPSFNIAYHVRRVGCPAPGDRKALCEFMSSVYAYQLDRSRPLWMTWVVEGLEDGKVALVTMVHHAYVDGIGASWVLGQLYKSEPGWQPPVMPEWKARPWPSWGKRLWWALRDWPQVMIQNMPRVISGVRQKKALDKAAREKGLDPHPEPSMMPKTPLNCALSPGRSFVCDDMPLEDFKRVGKHFGATINDVFLACCAGTVRQLFKRLNFNADKEPLIAGTPFAGTRRADSPGLGNFATLDYCWLPTHIEDPVERLRAASASATEMKAHLKASVEAGADINSILQICPPWLVKALRWYIAKQDGKVSIFGNVLVSNVPGPKEPIYLNKSKLDSWFSTGQIFDGTGLNMTMWSYCGRANLCVLTDSKVVPDGWVLFDGFVEELQKLVALLPEADNSTQSNAVTESPESSESTRSTESTQSTTASEAVIAKDEKVEAQ